MFLVDFNPKCGVIASGYEKARSIYLNNVKEKKCWYLKLALYMFKTFSAYTWTQSKLWTILLVRKHK